MENNSKEFDLRMLGKILCKFWILILVSALIFGVLGYGYSILTDNTVYTGKASFWVNVDDKNSTQIMGAAQMATNYSELVVTDKLRRSAVEYGSLDDEWNIGFEEAVKKLRTMISVSKSDENSQIFSVYVSSKDANETFVAITAVQNVMAEVIASVNADSADSAVSESYVTRLDDVQSMEDIIVSSSSHVMKAVVGGFIGLILSFITVFAYSLLNQKVDSARSVGDFIAYPLVGNILPVRKKQIEKNSNNEEFSQLPVDVRESFNVFRTKTLIDGIKPLVIGIVPATEKNTSEYIAFNLASASVKDGRKIALVCSSETERTDILAVDEKVAVSSFCIQDNGYYSARAILDAVRQCAANSDAVIVALPMAGKIEELSVIAENFDYSVISVRKGEAAKSVCATVSELENVNANIKGVCYFE